MLMITVKAMTNDYDDEEEEEKEVKNYWYSDDDDDEDSDNNKNDFDFEPVDVKVSRTGKNQTTPIAPVQLHIISTVVELLKLKLNLS